ncbi:glycine dehydrogenase (decarboxylating), mitochondrial [Trichomonascus vanleenenianus]|uniref:glycine decarboxylase subunit P n=1 Tax=Trichomonascus vanleenenianus TaxID=2268995 RepID=UPI003EC98546
MSGRALFRATRLAGMPAARLAGRRLLTTTAVRAASVLDPLDTYVERHNGSSSPKDIARLLEKVGHKDVDSFVEAVVPKDVLVNRPLNVEPADGLAESALTARLKEIASENQVYRSFIGKGYYGTIVPPVIQRNILECPEWYTSYTPYQPEISQGRLESLVNYQTLITDLTGMAVANASLLDEATAAAEAMIMSFHAKRGKKAVYYVDESVHPQTVAVLESRAKDFGIEILRGLPPAEGDSHSFGCVVQYPATDGSLADWKQLAAGVHKHGGIVSVATDLLALTVLKPPSEFNADIVFGSAQRFGVPFGYGGPHAAFFAVADSEKRKMPGRLIGKSKDRLGNPAYRLALQTREQHIKREKATSNICTAQALLANMTAMYAVYHGPEGLKKIAQRVYTATSLVADRIKAEAGANFEVLNKTWFDTLTIGLKNTSADAFIAKAAKEHRINLFKIDDSTIALSLDETVTKKDIADLLDLFGASAPASELEINEYASIPAEFQRTSKYLQYPVFNKYHSETELLRYMHHLQSKDLSLANSMIPLGSCTMKLNATTQMAPVTWPEFGNIHPFVPREQAKGYSILLKELEVDLADITGFDAVSLQPNSGAQGEYTGLRAIKAYLEAKGEGHRNICLIPVSAHGTNPASAAMCGLKVVSVKCKPNGELDLHDMEAKAEKYKKNLAAVMITYPSTFGVFEPGVKKAIDIVHSRGGQVYMDGANMNAQIGLTSPGEIGADVCHLNLHKTFCIPHGGGGPGMGPIGVKSHLAPFLPAHPIVHMDSATEQSIKPIAAAPWGSASILPISWAYIKGMGATGLKKATQLALLNANYMRERLSEHYPILYTNDNNKCAHEFILDVRGFKATAGIEAIDIAKRLQDYGFHAPTMSWPVANTLMIEPTESESLSELDRFCDALISIRQEIAAIEKGEMPKENNALVNSPHSQQDLLVAEWDRPYTREQAAYPLPYLRERKFWPSVTRLDDTYGDLNLFCSCDPVENEE